MPAVVPQVLPSMGGVDPSSLDAIILDGISAVTNSIDDHKVWRGRVAEFMDKFAEVLNDAEGKAKLKSGEAHYVMQSLTTMQEKAARSSRQLVQSLDALARLRTFLDGGREVAPDIATLSDRQLEEVLMAACPKCARERAAS